MSTDRVFPDAIPALLSQFAAYTGRVSDAGALNGEPMVGVVIDEALLGDLVASLMVWADDIGLSGLATITNGMNAATGFIVDRRDFVGLVDGYGREGES